MSNDIEKLKTVHDIRTVLAEEIVKLRNGSTTPANVNAIVNASGKILGTVKLEMEYNKLLGKIPEIPFIGVGKKNLPSLSDKKP